MKFDDIRMKKDGFKFNRIRTFEFVENDKEEEMISRWQKKWLYWNWNDTDLLLIWCVTGDTNQYHMNITIDGPK